MKWQLFQHTEYRIMLFNHFIAIVWCFDEFTDSRKLNNHDDVSTFKNAT